MFASSSSHAIGAFMVAVPDDLGTRRQWPPLLSSGLVGNGVLDEADYGHQDAASYHRSSNVSNHAAGLHQASGIEQLRPKAATDHSHDSVADWSQAELLQQGSRNIPAHTPTDQSHNDLH
jgi:hypothetical protein